MPSSTRRSRSRSPTRTPIKPVPHKKAHRPPPEIKDDVMDENTYQHQPSQPSSFPALELDTDDELLPPTQPLGEIKEDPIEESKSQEEEPKSKYDTPDTEVMNTLAPNIDQTIANVEAEKKQNQLMVFDRQLATAGNPNNTQDDQKDPSALLAKRYGYAQMHWGNLKAYYGDNLGLYVAIVANPPGSSRATRNAIQYNHYFNQFFNGLPVWGFQVAFPMTRGITGFNGPPFGNIEAAEPKKGQHVPTFGKYNEAVYNGGITSNRSLMFDLQWDKKGTEEPISRLNEALNWVDTAIDKVAHVSTLKLFPTITWKKENADDSTNAIYWKQALYKKLMKGDPDQYKYNKAFGPESEKLQPQEKLKLQQELAWTDVQLKERNAKLCKLENLLLYRLPMKGDMATNRLIEMTDWRQYYGKINFNDDLFVQIVIPWTVENGGPGLEHIRHVKWKLKTLIWCGPVTDVIDFSLNDYTNKAKYKPELFMDNIIKSMRETPQLVPITLEEGWKLQTNLTLINASALDLDAYTKYVQSH
jgi:hypothetical protein